MPYGIASASEVFHRMLHHIFDDIEGVENIHDDIIIWSNSVQEHPNRVIEVLQRERNKLNRVKCHLGVPEVRFFGGLDYCTRYQA